MRWLLRCTLCALSAAVIVTACSSFEGSTPDETPEAGALDGATITTPPGGDAAGPNVDANADADIPCSVRCRSGFCEDDGGCDPLVFVTNERYSAYLDVDGGGGPEFPQPGIGRADFLCNLSAGDGGTTFLALMSATGNEAKTRITGTGNGAHRPMRRQDGTVVGASYFDLFSDSAGTTLDAAINETITGGVVNSQDHVWTGTETNGAVSAYTCNGWTDGFNGDNGTYGIAGETNGSWVRAPGNTFCSEANRLYCFEILP